MKWKDYLSNRKNIVELAVTVIVITAALMGYSEFLDYNETREGVNLKDPVLEMLPVKDFTWVIFTFIYFPLLLALIRYGVQPEKILLGLQAYVFIIGFRILAMYMLPLNAPEEMIVLRDPFVEFFGPARIMERDLFFSGHTATLFLIYLLSANNWTKLFYLGSLIIVAAGLLFQHVHYSIDIFAAPFFTFTAYYITKRGRILILKGGS